MVQDITRFNRGSFAKLVKESMSSCEYIVNCILILLYKVNEYFLLKTYIYLFADENLKVCD